MRSYVNLLQILCVIFLFSCSQKEVSTAKEKPRKAEVYKMAELNTAQIKSLKTDSTVILLPGGILEEHGPYLPSFTDGYWNEKLTDTLATVIAANGWKVILFPTIPLGNSGANDVGKKFSYPGTYTVRFETLRSIFMDLATELGEQGFKRIFIIHGHGAPNHQRALDQAAAFFNDTYGGQMVNFMGLYPIMSQWFSAPKTKEEEAEDGFTIHAGLLESSSMLYLFPQLVDPSYKTAPSLTASDMPSLIAVAKAPHWPGYFGAVRLASAAHGKRAWQENTRQYTQYALDILAGKINLDTVARFADIMLQSKEDVTLDSLSLQEEAKRKVRQIQWMQQNNLNKALEQ